MSIKTGEFITISAADTTDKISAMGKDSSSFEFDWMPGLTAVLSLQVTNVEFPVEADWKDMTALSALWTTQPANNTAGVMYTVNGLSCRWMRVKVASVTGTGLGKLRIGVVANEES